MSNHCISQLLYNTIQIERLEAELTKYIKENQDLKAQLAAMQSSVEELEGQNQKLKDKNDELESGRVLDNKSDDGELENQRQLHNQELLENERKLRDELMKKDFELAQLKMIADHLKLENDSLKKLIASKALAGDPNQSMAKDFAMIDQLHSEKKRLQLQLSQTEETVKALQDKVEEKQRKIREQQEYVQYKDMYLELQDQNKRDAKKRRKHEEESEIEITTLKQRLNTMEQALYQPIDDDHRIKALEKEIENWKMKFVQINRSYHNLQDQYFALKMEYDQMQKRKPGQIETTQQVKIKNKLKIEEDEDDEFSKPFQGKKYVVESQAMNIEQSKYRRGEEHEEFEASHKIRGQRKNDQNQSEKQEDQTNPIPSPQNDIKPNFLDRIIGSLGLHDQPLYQTPQETPPFGQYPTFQSESRQSQPPNNEPRQSQPNRNQLYPEARQSQPNNPYYDQPQKTNSNMPRQSQSIYDDPNNLFPKEAPKKSPRQDEQPPQDPRYSQNRQSIPQQNDFRPSIPKDYYLPPPQPADPRLSQPKDPRQSIPNQDDQHKPYRSPETQDPRQSQPKDPRQSIPRQDNQYTPYPQDPRQSQPKDLRQDDQYNPYMPPQDPCQSQPKDPRQSIPRQDDQYIPQRPVQDPRYSQPRSSTQQDDLYNPIPKNNQQDQDPRYSSLNRQSIGQNDMNRQSNSKPTVELAQSRNEDDLSPITEFAPKSMIQSQTDENQKQENKQNRVYVPKSQVPKDQLKQYKQPMQTEQSQPKSRQQLKQEIKDILSESHSRSSQQQNSNARQTEPIK